MLNVVPRRVSAKRPSHCFAHNNIIGDGSLYYVVTCSLTMHSCPSVVNTNRLSYILATTDVRIYIKKTTMTMCKPSTSVDLNQSKCHTYAGRIIRSAKAGNRTRNPSAIDCDVKSKHCFA